MEKERKERIRRITQRSGLHQRYYEHRFFSQSSPYKIQIREDLCQVHEAYQYFRGKFQSKHKEKDTWVHLTTEHDQENENEGTEDSKEEQIKVFEKITMGVQHKGRITPKEANRLLRDFWPKTIVKRVEVKKRKEVADRFPDYFPLWVIVTMSPGHTFENWLDWPQCEDNWPQQFDKGLFKEESEWIIQE